jgi:hypothetical protein
MRIDIITEEIWHFIGAFQQSTEAARGRGEYDAYRASKVQYEEGKLQLADVPFSAPHRLIEFQPGVKVITPADAATAGFAKGGQSFHPLTGIAVPLPDLALPPVTVPMAMPQLGSFPPGFSFELQPPASVAVILGQQNRLSDQDIMIQHDHGASFTPLSAFDAPMQALLAKAGALEKFAHYDHPADVQAIQTLGEVIAEDAASLVAGEGAVVIAGDAVFGMHLNGVRVDAAPDLDDHLPEVPEPVSVRPGSTWEEEVVAEAAADAAHVAVLGGDTLVNEVVLTVSWLDAPVMLVQGDAMAISVISQINVLSDIDSGVCSPPGENQVFNFVQQAVNAAPLPAVAEADAGAFPINWVITTLDADLVVCDWMTQKNFVIDHDILSVSWSGSSSFLRLGDNSLINLTQLVELGQSYDLIVIGGAMISISMIRQMNVLLDSDWVQTSDGSATVSTGDNLLWNSAAITWSGVDTMTAMDQAHADLAEAVAGGTTGAIPLSVSDQAFEGIGVLNVLYIKGDYLTLTMIEQTNILGDADQVSALANDAVATGEAEITIMTGSNALINAAVIDSVGIDSDIHVAGEIYTDAVIYQAEFIDQNSGELYVGQGSAALASEAVVFLADGMLADEGAAPVYVADATLISGQADGVNAVLV